jgi:hypothetical protein
VSVELKQARFTIVWVRPAPHGDVTWTCNDKVVATAYLSSIFSHALMTGWVMQIREQSAMEYVLRSDGTYDSFNKVRCRYYTVVSTPAVPSP